jgi:hypothetical protein
MTDKANCWREIGLRLGIEVIAPARVCLAGNEAQFTALLPQFGAESGMIVDAEWSAIEPHCAALIEAGYGYSCVTLDHAAGAENVVEILSDWGWTDNAPKPNWLNN